LQPVYEEFHDVISGRDTLREIDSHVVQAQSRVAEADRKMDELNSELTRIRIEMAAQYRDLARFRLDDIKAGNVTDRLTKAHLAVPAYMQQHKQALEVLEQEINQSQERQQHLNEQRETARDERDRADDAFEKQFEITQSGLEKTDAYQRQLEQLDAALQIARRADKKATQAAEDLSTKGRPYQDDELFMYLWGRKYLTADYRYGGIVRMLDGWVARLINFKENRADYYMLNELPQRLREHADRAAEEADRQGKALQQMEEEAAEKEGVISLQDDLEKKEKKLQEINDQIEAEEKRYKELLHQKNDFAAGEDDYTVKIVTMLAGELEHQDIIALFQQAQHTPRPEDDAVVMQLHQLQKTQESLADRISQLKANQQEQRNALEEIVKLRDKFRRNNYDAQYSSFPTNLGLGILLGEILRGGLSSGSAWDRLDRVHKWNYPKVGRTSRTGRSFGGGGFRSGGGFGGGGFRTGGGF
jgi:chromosome segregation ATPase